jgi:hypothetical protein
VGIPISDVFAAALQLPDDQFQQTIVPCTLTISSVATRYYASPDDPSIEGKEVVTISGSGSGFLFYSPGETYFTRRFAVTQAPSLYGVVYVRESVEDDTFDADGDGGHGGDTSDSFIVELSGPDPLLIDPAAWQSTVSVKAIGSFIYNTTQNVDPTTALAVLNEGPMPQGAFSAVLATTLELFAPKRILTFHMPYQIPFPIG